MPYCVGTKNGFVVTWLTNTIFHFLCAGNEPASTAWAGVIMPPISASAADRPAPCSNPRRMPCTSSLSSFACAISVSRLSVVEHFTVHNGASRKSSGKTSTGTGHHSFRKAHVHARTHDYPQKMLYHALLPTNRCIPLTSLTN